ncbi:MAG: hypothetical protein LQ343_005132 [Gyalolechia ehrenbergii]|nr:MAG: hypothetical protein LQ343_005132 [Gyalolechia ehrenbergii]
MSSAPQASGQVEDKQFDFASLTPVNTEAVSNFHGVGDTIRKQPSNNEHHSLFYRLDIPTGSIQIDSAASVHSLSSDATTEIASSDGAEAAVQGCYVLSIIPNHPPLRPKFGWAVGAGRWVKDPDTGSVDLLLAAGANIYPRHLSFRFDEFGRLTLDVLHSGIELDGKPVAKGSSRMLLHSNFIRIGLLLYRFAFILPREEEQAFQNKKNEFMMEYMGLQQAPNELTSATPSVNDMKIGDWVIHGTAGSSATSVVEAASNLRTSEVVAVKRLRRSNGRTAQKTSQEVEIYEALQVIQHHRHGHYVMYMHSVLYKHEKDWHGVPDEVFLLWTPLGAGTFQQFSSSGVWSSKAFNIRLMLFCQICLGLQAVHEAGWIHRDIKPQNIYVVSLVPPRAVLGDFGAAVRASESGLTPQPGSCGTIGWLAPELENSAFALKYKQAVDVWSMGAVGYFLFISGRLPWFSLKGHNMFRHTDDPAWQTYRLMMDTLATRRPESLQGLLYQMMRTYPNQRTSLRSALASPALQATMSLLETDNGQHAPTGSKRSAP